MSWVPRLCLLVLLPSGVLGCRHRESMAADNPAPAVDPFRLRRLQAGRRTRGRRRQTLLVPARQIHHGQPAQRARTSPRRRSGRGHADPRLLDGQVRNDARRSGSASSANSRPTPRPSFPPATTCPSATSTSPRRRRSAGSSPSSATHPASSRTDVGVSPAHRSAVGIRLPGRHDDGHLVRRHAQQQAGELQGQAVQRRRTRAVARPGRAGRQLPGQRVGPARHARQHVRVVPRLVSRETARRRRSRPVHHAHRAASRVRRGGRWTDDGWPCRSAFRLRFEPERRYDHIGFRVVAVRP